MKNILIATDFSPAANNAVVYGVELANILNARVILFSACQQIAIPVLTVPVIISQEEMRIHVQRQLADEARLLTERYNTWVTTNCKSGNACQAILEAVKENQVDLVITGMKKHGKKIRRIMGSTVTELISKIEVPMIIVPEEAKFSSVANMALANESDIVPDSDWHVLDALREIGERFHSKLYLVRVEKNLFQKAYQVSHRPLELSRVMHTLDPVFECIEGQDVPGALTQFVDSYHINLLAMLPHKHPLLERLFIKSTTRAMAFESPIPLLILPEKRKRFSYAYDDDNELQFN